MSRGVLRRETAPEVKFGIAWTLGVHGTVIALVLLGLRPPEPMPRVYAVELVAAPAPTEAKRVARAAVERPAEPPAPVRTKASKKPVPVPPKAAKTDPRAEATPRTRSEVQPLPGETPGSGTDIANVKTPGLEFPYPEYLRNIVSEVYRRWDRPLGNTALRAEVSFLILRDGTIKDIRFQTRSGNFAFDLSAQGAIEAAGRAQAFGPLPDGYPADVLPVAFFFTPRTEP